MRVLICGDVHWSTYASILRRRGTDYSKRLENCVNSINWVEQTAEESGCDLVVYLGDFFDRADINSEEISALREIQWSNIKHQIIVGNHELGSADGNYSTAQALQLLPNFEVISKPKMDVGFGYKFIYLPYIFERDRKTVTEYMNSLEAERGLSFKTQECKSAIIFSHNDLKGVNYGAFESKEGFEISDIENNCTFCFNGHIHNSQFITKKIINVGNITGQNFNEDASKYEHHVFMLDTEKVRVESFVNPYAYNFYKEEVNTEADISRIIAILQPHSVLSIKCIESLVPQLKEELSKCPNVEDYRVVTVVEEKDTPKEDIKEIISSDHLAQFRDYIIEKLGSTEAVVKELQEVMLGN